MIYFPNKGEKYTAALRLIYHKLIIKRGFKEKYRKNLKKIYLAEAIFKSDEAQPVNLDDYLSNLFTAVILKKPFNYQISLNGNYLVDIKILTALILKLCENNRFLKLESFKGKIVITSNSKIDIMTLKLVKKLNGIFLREIKTQKYYVILPLSHTQKNSKGFETAYFLLQNPYSPINLFF